MNRFGGNVLERTYVIGVDFGSDSVRAIVVNCINGNTMGSGECYYERWMKGMYCNPSERMFRQHPLDYLESLEVSIKEALEQVGENAGQYIKAIAVDTTGSTPCPVDSDGIPLALLPEFEENPNAMFYLWKDHTSIEEAKEITHIIKDFNGEDYTRFQGTYSSEWYWAKILHGSRVDSKVKEKAYAWVEHCDWIPAVLTGKTKPDDMYRSSCAAGHKALWHSDFGGLPEDECLEAIDPYLRYVGEHYTIEPKTSVNNVGKITEAWAERLGVNTDVVIGGSSLDAHAGAVGAGIKSNTLVKVIGTSTVDMLVNKREVLRGKDLKDCCGQAENSILPGYIGMEAGQAAFGDIYSWFRNVLMWPINYYIKGDCDSTSDTVNKKLKDVYEHMIEDLCTEAAKRDECDDLITIDWFNGRRYPIINESVKGGMYGLTLGTDTVNIFKSIVFSTVFGTRRIFDSFVTRGIQIDEVITVGGISKKSPYIMQLMADILKRPIKVSESEQACAQGAAMYAAVACGIYGTLEEAQEFMCQGYEKIYIPNNQNFKKYDKMYFQYLKFGKHIDEIQQEIQKI